MEIETDGEDSQETAEQKDTETEENPSQGPSQSYLAEEDGATCSVCLESWTNCGAHRICSLKCGHLFGHKCILRWLDSQPKKSCPTCKQSVKRSDLRFIYAKKLVAVDNLELESLKQQLENTLAQKNAALQTISKYISREQVLTAEIQQLKKKLNALSGKKADLRLTSQTPVSRIRLYMEKNVEICQKSGCRECRVFDISVPQDLILVSSRSPTDLFGGFGVKIIGLSNYRPIKFIPLHRDIIRDMCIHPSENKVLTVATDKKLRITDVQSTNAVATVSLESAPWACSWSPKSPQDVVIGTQNGTVLVFDSRNTAEPKTSVSIPGDFSPVVSLAGVKDDDSGTETLLVSKLSSVWAFEFHPDGSYSRHLLPLEGPFLSLKYDQGTKHLLVSSRPNSQLPFARHTICYLERTNDPYAISCNTVHTFKGGSTAKWLANTSCFVPGNIVAGHHENRKSILLYSVNTGEEVGSCPTHDNIVLDIKGFETNNGKFLTYLNQKKLEFFKFNHT
ncbi:E3 ubiquitin-protein ligase RFWD3-like [Anthonomus grandis grandis]|uniref:E3 ubiquitin-protein ligase RFWD3-like n=1 Tax=Anthonomus grandis grandis TaxID=2921223 RepID=UPI0021654447|nr:E3 ubiquitin-protein ligase RFWD3-like [Anthonomus grandis grandis]XP_050303640.1 E3 ubiquitin-protein ligase RFWD3-like [Anthonomus grandis grandis]